MTRLSTRDSDVSSGNGINLGHGELSQQPCSACSLARPHKAVDGRASDGCAGGMRLSQQRADRCALPALQSRHARRRQGLRVQLVRLPHADSFPVHRRRYRRSQKDHVGQAHDDAGRRARGDQGGSRLDGAPGRHRRRHRRRSAGRRFRRQRRPRADGLRRRGDQPVELHARHGEPQALAPSHVGRST